MVVAGFKRFCRRLSAFHHWRSCPVLALVRLITPFAPQRHLLLQCGVYCCTTKRVQDCPPPNQAYIRIFISLHCSNHAVPIKACLVCSISADALEILPSRATQSAYVAQIPRIPILTRSMPSLSSWPLFSHGHPTCGFSRRGVCSSYPLL
jgi:hypothetical protein